MTDLDQNSTRWPDVPRTCFGPGMPRHLNACVDWVLSGPHGMTGYIEGYRRAAEAVYESTVRTRTSPEYTVFPLAFLWRHHVELALKAIIALGRELKHEDGRFPEHHGLVNLWRAAKPHLVDCSNAQNPELVNVEANLYEFERIDPASLGFRYPIEKSSGV